MKQGLVLAGLLLASAAPAEVLKVDATAPVPPPRVGYFNFGTAVSPNGARLDINSRYLALNGRPIVPVMGEIHFVRLPAEEWDEELAKIKASGVDIVATYLFWNYHEETPGDFNWTGRRDVRRFVELAAKHRLKVIVRLGPWSHGEVRYGGTPDWVVRSGPTRTSDPTYLCYVDRYWGQVARQLHGLYWKDGGPIIGVQLENEYNLTGPGQGEQHIADLKAIALRHGIDVPLYTVTGWDAAVYPRREVTPVFGGYPDEPWGVSTEKLPPKETYAFRFDSRVSGNLGAQTRGSGGDADPDIPNTPFLGAEYAGGLPTMYRRRPILQPDDIASMIPVQLGSGVNLYGYYMYHGGANLIGRTTLEEKTAIGGYNDLPIIDYDFQAPYGEYGEAAPVLSYIRPFHYFLQSYGAQLANTLVRRPEVTPAALDDLKTLRWSVRTNGDSGFIFVNNHVRQYPMATHQDVHFQVALPDKRLSLPLEGVTIQPDAYFIWPIGLDLGGQKLAWASAQPVTHLAVAEESLHVFSASPGIPPEFAFDAGTQVSGPASINHLSNGLVVATVKAPGPSAVLTVQRFGAPTQRVLVLTQDQARHLQLGDFAGVRRLIISEDDLVRNQGELSFTSKGNPDFSLLVYPKLPSRTHASPSLHEAGTDGIFTRYTASARRKQISASAELVRKPGAAPAVPIGGPAKAAIEPWPEELSRSAGEWRITVPANALQGVDDAILRIDFAGDVGRLFSGPTLLDDRFWNGLEWRVGLRRNANVLGKPLTLTISPLRADAPIYIDEKYRPKLPKNGQIAVLKTVSIEPRYRLDIMATSKTK